MLEVHEEAALRHPRPFLYGILADVRRGPAFVPGCTALEIIEETPTNLRLRCTVKGLGALEIEVRFESHGLTMQLLSGLPGTVEARWQIQTIEAGSSRVILDARSDLPSGWRFILKRRTVEGALQAALTQLQKRADALAWSPALTGQRPSPQLMNLGNSLTAAPAALPGPV